MRDEFAFRTRPETDTLFDRLVAVIEDWNGPDEMGFTIRLRLVPDLMAEIDRPLDLGRFGG
jgi:hypothetical protein